MREESLMQRWHSLTSLVLAVGMLCACSKADLKPEPPRDLAAGPQIVREKSGGKDNFLPMASTQLAFASLKMVEPDTKIVSVRRFRVSPFSIYADYASFNHPVDVPFFAKNQIVIRFKPVVSSSQMQSFLDDYSVDPVDVAAELGLLVVQLRARPIADGDVVIKGTDEAAKLDVFLTSQKMTQDDRVLAATPNAIVSADQRTPLTLGSGPRNVKDGSSGEKEDWGIADSHFSELWPRLPGPFKMGVVDVGFAPHDDLDLVNASAVDAPPNYHGNFVAGIMCARHNGIGVRGALKNCTVEYAASAQVLNRIDRVEGTVTVQATAVAAFMSEYLLSAYRLIREHSDVKVINISLGYNWRANLDLDPSSDPQLRDIIRGQGISALALLEYAAEKGVTIVSAAGNDSSGLSKPLDARFSSPINFAAFLMASDSQWSSAIVVEAHDRNGKRPPFSNTGGQISCPGVDVQSTVSSPANWIGVDDGTSMAAPYCAAALLALRYLIPSLDQREAIACLQKSNRRRENVPLLNLKYAVDNCGSNSLAKDPNGRAENMRVRTESLVLVAPFAASNEGCKYELRREFRITPIADRGDGQGPEFTNATSQDEVRQYARALIRRGCKEPVFIVAAFGFDPEAKMRQEFAQAVMQEVFRVKYPGGVAIIQWPLFGDVGDMQRFNDRVVVIVGDKTFEDRLNPN